MTKAQLAQKYLLQNHVFKYVGIVLAVCGFFVFVSLYQSFIGGDIINFIRRPTLIPIMVIPFLPGLIFLLLSKKARSKATKILMDAADQQSKPAVKK